ncbi:hypothetical protein SAY86_004065 [Trapa natans]|uniref:Ubiquitin-like domain-containing protein n=1 Tax=Trapa natans TaxID=22666 RepID=A0AAN7N5U9_TRANT|nr:hypothetical protein SAY86_004065 [Trapa natans]
MMMKLRSKKSSKGSRSSKLGGGVINNLKEKKGQYSSNGLVGEIQWELRPGGMLVQKRESISDGHHKSGYQGTITIRVSYGGAQWFEIPIESTSTFGELKMVLSMVTSLEPREQRLLFRGKEREDTEYLHMTGVGDRDKVLLLEDPAIKERKRLLLLHAVPGSGQPMASPPFQTISV